MNIFSSLKFQQMSVVIHTNLGDMRAELFHKQAPRSCRNFLALAASGYYDGLIFHRLIRDFMVQGGDPTGEGKGGKNFQGEYQPDEFVPELTHGSRGILSFANLGKPETVGSQFFICFDRQDHLNGVYSVFGRLVGNFESTLAKIEDVEVGKKSRPVIDIKIDKISIQYNPIAEADNPI